MKPSVNIAAVISLTNDVIVRATFDRFLTVEFYLRRRGISTTWITRWGKAFGRKAAALYRAAHQGASPEQRWENGRLVYVYSDIDALDGAMTHYTAHKVAGPLLSSVAYDRKAAARTQLRDRLGRFARAYTVTWNGPVGANSRGRLTQERAARLVRQLTGDHRMSNVVVRDFRGNRADFATAA